MRWWNSTPAVRQLLQSKTALMFWLFPRSKHPSAPSSIWQLGSVTGRNRVTQRPLQYLRLRQCHLHRLVLSSASAATSSNVRDRVRVPIDNHPDTANALKTAGALRRASQLAAEGRAEPEPYHLKQYPTSAEILARCASPFSSKPSRNFVSNALTP